MAWRPARFLLEGVLDNTVKNRVSGWMRFAGLNEKVVVNLEGDFHRDIQGAKIRIRGEAVNNSTEAQKYMEDFCLNPSRGRRRRRGRGYCGCRCGREGGRRRRQIAASPEWTPRSSGARGQ